MSIWYQHVIKLLPLLIAISGSTSAFGNEQFGIAGFQHRSRCVAESDLPPSGDLYAVRIDTPGTISSNEFNNENQPVDVGRLPGEFERQHALLIGCHELLCETPGLFMEMVRHTAGRIAIIALVSNAAEYSLAQSLLQKNRVRASHVRFVEVPHDTMWTRDYGPIIVYHEEKGPIILDADYDPERPNDDRVPKELAHMFRLPLVRVPLMLHGGNVLSNGEGLAVSTIKICDDNITVGIDETTVVEIMKYLYGFREIIMLESLRDEETGHVDMFATFTASNTIVVGTYDPEYDPKNAAILDRNAARLAEVKMDNTSKRLRVIRVPMPPHSDGLWRTYTNVLFANGVVLVPVYPSLDHGGRREALAIFSSILPTWEIVGIDASQIIELNGGMQCIAMNLGPISLRNFLEAWRHPEPFAARRKGLAKRAVYEKDCHSALSRAFCSRREYDTVGRGPFL